VRSGAPRRAADDQRCESFDPNLAAAYAEDVLPATARRDFENHLAGCQSCRSEYADFALINRVDATPTIQTEPTPSLIARVRAFFGSLTPAWGPQLAMGLPALAVVLLGGLAWWIVTSGSSSEVNVATGSKEARPTPPEIAPVPANGVSRPAQGEATQQPPQATNASEPSNPVGPTSKPSEPAKTVRPPKPPPERVRPESEDSVTRSVDTGPSSEPSSRIRRAGGKTFVLVGGAWTDRDYLVRDRSKSVTSTTIERGTAAFDAAVESTPVVAEYAKIEGKVVVMEGETVFTIVGGGPK
jgi:hypothetical protein